MINKFHVNGIKNETLCDLNKNSNAAKAVGAECELSETFYITTNRRTRALQVRLTSQGLSLRRETNGAFKEQLINIRDIIGSRCVNGQKHQQNRESSSSSFVCSKSFSVRSSDAIPPDVSAYLHIYAYEMVKGCRRERTVLTLRFRSFDKYEDNIVDAEKWHHAIRVYRNALLNNIVDINDSRRMLVLLNPKAGSGKGREYFQQQVEPIFIEADLPYELHVTKRPNFAKEFVYMNCSSGGNSPPPWRGIVIIGGDGLFSEVVNGLLQLLDWRTVLKNLPIGIIPCGTANGLARSIAHFYNEPYQPKPIVNAAITVVGGHTAPMDVVRIETKRRILYSFLSVGWGLISEMELKRERLKSIHRFKLWSMVQAHLRPHQGKVCYLPTSVSSERRSEVKEELSAPQNLCSESELFFATIDSDDDETDENFRDVISVDNIGTLSHSISFYSAASRKSAYFSVDESTYESMNHEDDQTSNEQLQEKRKNCVDIIFGPSPNLVPSLLSPVPDDWITEEGNFIMVQAAYRSHLGVDYFFAPSSELNDGIIYLVIVREGLSKSDLMHFLLNMSSGTHLPSESNNQFIKVVPVHAFRIEPFSNEGALTIDGKRVDNSAIQGEIFQGVVNVMVPKSA